MSSGSRNLVINLLERAVSSDINRLQSFAQADVAEILRTTYAGAIGNVALDQAGTPPSADTSPGAAVIFNGLLAVPQAASTDLFVTAGELFVVDPELVPSPNDSPAHLIDDPGINSSGTLSLTPNSSGSRRIDVVEFARVRSDRDGEGTRDSAALVTESASRDIYNTATGAFAPATVPKVYSAGLLTYRIRRGTPGAGYPGNISGWTPIMVASVPNGAATWDDAVCWDVRPMAEDYISRKSAHTAGFARARVAGSSNLFTDTTELLMLGTLEGQIGTSRFGGVMPLTGYTFLGDGTTFDDVAIGTLGQGKALAPGPQAYFLYLVMPYGLPRWMELNPATSGNRLPNGFRGILVATQEVLPLNNNGAPSGALALPGYTGLTPSSSNAVLVSVSAVGPNSGNQIVSPPTQVDDEIFIGTQVPTTGPSSGAFTVDLSDGSPGGSNNPIPPGTRKLRLLLNFSVTTPAASNGTFHVTSIAESTSGTLIVDSESLPSSVFENATGSSFSGSIQVAVDCYLNKQYPAASGATTRTLTIATSVTGSTTVASMRAIVDKIWL